MPLKTSRDVGVDQRDSGSHADRGRADALESEGSRQHRDAGGAVGTYEGESG